MDQPALHPLITLQLSETGPLLYPAVLPGFSWYCGTLQSVPGNFDTNVKSLNPLTARATEGKCHEETQEAFVKINEGLTTALP